MRGRRSIALLALGVYLATGLCCVNIAEAKDLGARMDEGIQARDKGRYNEALDAFNEALKLATAQGKEDKKAWALMSIGIVYWNLSQYQKALEYDQQALAIYRRTKDVKGEGSALGNIGIVHDLLGQYEKALEYYQQALAIQRKMGNVDGEGADLCNIGVVYQELGQYEKALDYHQQALKIFKKIGDVTFEGNVLTNIGIVYRNLGQHEKALEYYQQSLAIYRRIGDGNGEGSVLSNIGVVHLYLGQYEKALEYFEPALAIRKKIGDVDGVDVELTNIGDVYGHLGQYERALEYHQQALAVSRKTWEVNGESKHLTNMSLDLLALGKPDKAEAELAASIKVFEAIRAKVRSEKERTGFQDTMPDAYGTLAAARLAMAKPESAFEAIERGRAKSFLDLLGTRETTARRRSKEKTAELARMENDLSTLRRERVRAASAPAGSNTRSVPALDRNISDTDKKRMDLIDQMRRSDPELGSLVTVDAPTLKEIQSMLSPGTLMVEYFHNGEGVISKKNMNELWVFLVYRDGFEFKKVAVTKNHLQNDLDEYASLLANPKSDPSELEAVSSKLYGWLIEPIQARIKKLQPNTLVIVPWGSMFKVPFASLAPKGGEPMGATQNIVVAPSAGIYRYVIKKRASGRQNILALGNPQPSSKPLPNAEREVKEIVSLFSKSTLRTGVHATKTLLKADATELGNPDVIHLACHGEFNDQVPELSYLALAPDQQNDGKLEMHELFDLDWKGVSLVTLSACQSGKGKLGAGDDLIGMVRGFMFAGTPSVLSSLWKVNDEATCTLMISFYKNYTSGMSKPESLRNAQLAMLKNRKWSHPYYWSGFVLFGDWE